MTKRLRYILPLCTIALVAVASTHVAHAEDILTMFGLNISQWIAESLANLFYTLQTIASWLVAIAGSLLNYSINLTLNIKTFVDNTPAIYDVWKAIRDISGMVIIFSLIYAALRLVLGFDAKFGDLIKNIVIAGVLINFSFFATGIGIDASNVISIQLYNTIAPANSLNPANMNPSNIQNTLDDGGLSDIFMKSLDISSLYNNSKSISDVSQTDGGTWSLPLQIIIRGVTSIIIMLTAAFSFFFAALAFIVRFIILIMLLAFSPIWFASHILPQLKEYATKWTSLYIGQLTFMPVYLLLMYFALNVLTSSEYFKNFGVQASASSISEQGQLLALMLNAVFVIILINIPLLAAVKLGGSATSWIDTKKYGAEGISRQISGFLGRNTVGKWASTAQDKIVKSQPYLANTMVGQAVLKNTLGAAANSGFGSGQSRVAADAAAKARTTAQNAGKRTQQRMQALKAALALPNTDPGKSAAVRAALNPLTTSEKANLDKDILKNGYVVQHLDENTHKAIANHATKSDADKAEIEEARIDSLLNYMGSAQGSAPALDTVAAQNMMNNMSGDTLTRLLQDPRMIAAVGTPATGDVFITYLRITQLKTMDSVDPGLRAIIGARIHDIPNCGPGGTTHPAYDYVLNNKPVWPW